MAPHTKVAAQADSKEYYVKKLQGRKLSLSLEYKTVTLAWQITLGIAAALLLSSYSFGEKTLNAPLLLIGAIYGVAALFCYFVALRIKREMLDGSQELSGRTRFCGILMLPFIALGNIFMCIAGFVLIKRKKSIEYQVLIYSLLVPLATLLVSALNLLKPAVVSTFYLGMWLLLAIVLFNILLIVASSFFIKGKQVDKRLVPLAILSMLQICYGNVFGFLFGLMVLSKIFHKDENVSIEWIDIVRRLFKNYMAIIGLFVVVFLISLSLVSLITFDYTIATANDYANILRSPSMAYPFGTDNYGRCVFTRIVFGARISLIVGLLSTAIPIIIGGTLGAIAGYYGKATENIIMRSLDILYAVPEMLMAIAIVAAFGASTFNLIIALSASSIAVYARTVRATVLSLSRQEFVEAAKACGAKNRLIIFRHIIPNSLAPVIVRATIGIGAAVLSTSALSYLGLGVEPHIPEWGNVLKAGSSYLETNPYIAIFPGLAIILIVLAFNFFGDGLRDALDPKLK